MEEILRKIAVALVLGSLAFAPRLAAAQTHEKYLEELAIEGADTPAKHEALAMHFAAKATDARSEAKLHEAMAKSYRLGPHKGTETAEMAQHCNKIAENEESIAKEFDALAKSHEEMAKKK